MSDKERIKEVKRLYYLKNKTRLQKVRKQYYLDNAEKIKKASKEYYSNNKETVINTHKKWYQENKDKRAISCKEYRDNNRDKCNHWAARRRASKLQATPPWITKEHIKEIEYFYILAKELNWLSEVPLEVDHIVPLQGKDVCGLHVPWNLQILDQVTNRAKWNNL